MSEQPAADDRAIEVAIVEDDEPSRDGLRLLIDGTPGFRCAAAYGSVEEALREIVGVAPDVVLLDIHLPGTPGSEGVRLIKERCPACQVVMLTVYSEEDKIFESICNGACGYLLKRTTPDRLIQGLAEAHRGGAPMSPEIARKVVTLFQKVRPRSVVEHDLTPQEVRLLRLLAEGRTYDGAADSLGVSVNTVRNYIRSVYDKLHVHSKSEAVSKALRAGILAQERTGALARARAAWIVMGLTEAVAARAGASFPVEPVRTLDAIHLATALRFTEVFPDLRILTLDRRVSENAVALGIGR